MSRASDIGVFDIFKSGVHLVSLDRVLRVMKQTGLDMKDKYRETATGGLGIG